MGKAESKKRKKGTSLVLRFLAGLAGFILGGVLGWVVGYFLAVVINGGPLIDQQGLIMLFFGPIGFLIGGVIGLLVWVGIFLFGLLALILVGAALGPSHKGLVWPVVVVVCFVVFFCIQAACHPLRGRTDQTQSWRQQFPTQDEQEVQRFLEYVTRQAGARAAPPAPKRAEHAK